MWKVARDHSSVQRAFEREGNEIFQFKVYTESLAVIHTEIRAVIAALGRQETSKSVGVQPLNLGEMDEVSCSLLNLTHRCNSALTALFPTLQFS